MLRSSLLAVLLLSLPLACTAPGTDRSAAEIPCTCGTPMGDLEGCAHPDCLAGRNNPDNPDCVCGTLEIPAAKER